MPCSVISVYMEFYETSSNAGAKMTHWRWHNYHAHY